VLKKRRPVSGLIAGDGLFYVQDRELLLIFSHKRLIAYFVDDGWVLGLGKMGSASMKRHRAWVESRVEGRRVKRDELVDELLVRELGLVQCGVVANGIV